jgi:glycine/D-amino acid oxidase-like deaminating enzyme
MAKSIVIVGSGIFGATAAIELRTRGWEVTVLDPGPPHPLAASTDISKMIRADYGDDELYIELMEECFPVWREWNERWGDDLYHEDGFLILAGGRLEMGGYERTSFATLKARGYPLEPLGPTVIGSRFPAWESAGEVEGYFNPVGGWAASGAVVERLIGDATSAGVRLVPAAVRELLIDESSVVGVWTDDGGRVEADATIVSAGAWTPRLVPAVEQLITTTGHPVMHFRPHGLERFMPPAFPPWAADIANTGWYGFPVIDGVVKVANHGPGIPTAATGERVVGEEWEELFRSFLADRIPLLADAPVVHTRLCLYTDTQDGDFLIDRHPELENLIVATGGSGHGFKFAPVLGALAARAVEDEERTPRFRWRSPTRAHKEAARHTGTG